MFGIVIENGADLDRVRAMSGDGSDGGNVSMVAMMVE